MQNFSYINVNSFLSTRSLLEIKKERWNAYAPVDKSSQQK